MTPRIAVLGDLMVDHTVFVEPKKIAPEAPIIAYDVRGEEFRNGAAAAVNDCVASLGVPTRLAMAMAMTGLPVSRKTRLVATGSRNPAIVARFDADAYFAWTEEKMTSLLEALADYNPTAVIVSDYGKGFVCDDLVYRVRDTVGRQTVILADPYTPDWRVYEGADILLPSRAAAAEFLEDEDLRGFPAVVCKLDREGVRIYGTSDRPIVLESLCRNVVDVTGAGDQFAATLAANVAPGVPLVKAVWLANLAAGMQCERRGVQPVTAEELQTRMNQIGELRVSA